MASVVGGTTSEISGGSFANGAVTAAMSYVLNASTEKRQVKHNWESGPDSETHGIWEVYSLGGGNEHHSKIEVDLFFPSGTDLEATADAIFTDLLQFEGFDESGEYNVLLLDEISGASFFEDGIPVPATVRLTSYEHARVLVADTSANHFLHGTRNWQVTVKTGGYITLSTGAIESYNGFANRVFWGQYQNFRSSGAQHTIWTDYFNSIGNSHNARMSSYRIREGQLP